MTGAFPAYSLCFNPRSYERSDCARVEISIQGRCFNPRSYERSDSIREKLMADGKLFQSTLLRKERRCTSTRRSLKRRVSIHAPTKGATADKSCVFM